MTLTEMFGWYIGLNTDYADCQVCGASVKLHDKHLAWHQQNDIHVTRM